MKTTKNVFLLTAATALVGLGVNTIGTDLISGAAEIVLGFLAVVIYEVTE
jgi:hypothetical protein